MRRMLLAGGCAGAVLAGGCAALVLAGASASQSPRAATACDRDGSSVVVTLDRRRRATLAIGQAGEILVDGRPCAEASTASTAVVRLAGGRGAQRPTVDLGGGSFEAVEVHAELGGGADRLRLRGRAGAESHVVRPDQIELDPSAGSSVSLAGVASLRIETRGGRDAVDARSFGRRLALRGGAAGDELRAGSARARLRGGSGEDRLHGGRGSDRIDGGGGADRAWGGGGRDRIDGQRGTDRCWGGGATDALISCAPPFDGTSSPLSPRLRERMQGRSWRRGCPVGRGRLRLLVVPHWTMGDRDTHRGRLVVHRDADAQVLRAMRSMFRHRFPIRRMELIDRYGGDDRRSMDADNTSAFNCRYVAGTRRWSEHAYGRALDLNPIENPYVTRSGHVSPPAGHPYAKRSRRAPGMIRAGDATVRAFRRVGWKWGGAWRPTRDYQHFSSSGR